MLINLITEIKWTNFFEKYNLQNLTQEDRDNLTRFISIKEIALIINNLAEQKERTRPG